MIMLSLELTGKIPFEIVYLHGLVMDEHGQKMSKSKGNVIDPIDVMDDMGTDAVRFTMLVGSTPGINTNLSLQKVEANRNFANKVWNAGRFVLGNLENAPEKPLQEPDWTLADSWIWARLQDLIRNVDRLFNNHQYGEAGRYIYDFFWGEYADWYLEISKKQVSQGGDRAFYTIETLIKVLDQCLRLLHPFTPYVTEELWQHLKSAVSESPYKDRIGEWDEALMVTSWPEPRPKENWEDEKVKNFGLIQEIVRTIRNLRAEKNIKPGHLIPATFITSEYSSKIMEEMGSLATLAQLDPDKIIVNDKLEKKSKDQIALVAGPVEIYLPMSELMDINEEKTRLTSELQGIQEQIVRLEALLAGDFSKKAPGAVVKKEQEKLENYQETAKTIQEQLDNLIDLS
jgi:valyl-tRNA synthetase